MAQMVGYGAAGDLEYAAMTLGCAVANGYFGLRGGAEGKRGGHHGAGGYSGKKKSSHGCEYTDQTRVKQDN